MRIAVSDFVTNTNFLCLPRRSWDFLRPKVSMRRSN